MNASFAPTRPKLTATVDGPVATLAIDNPAKRNALDLDMWRALPGIVAALDQDERVRVIVLRGAGSESFASGADRFQPFAAYEVDEHCGESRLGASRRLQEWLQQFAMTPRSRAAFVRETATGSLAAEIAARRRPPGAA